MLEGSAQEGPSVRRVQDPVCHWLFVKGLESSKTCWDEWWQDETGQQATVVMSGSSQWNDNTATINSRCQKSHHRNWFYGQHHSKEFWSYLYYIGQSCEFHLQYKEFDLTLLSSVCKCSCMSAPRVFMSLWICSWAPKRLCFKCRKKSTVTTWTFLCFASKSLKTR